MDNDRPRILIVDDDQGTARTTALILERKGYLVETAHSGPEAIERVHEEVFDVIFLDIKMPVMNGVETHRRIKEIRPDVLVVMMTAYAVEGLVAQALEDGAHEVLYKPLDFDRLLKIVNQAPTAEAGARVLVVDDNPAICDALEDALADEGHVVTTASTGEEAVAFVRQETYDVAFIDMKLPTIDGLETYLAIKEVNPEATAVVMTAYRYELRDLIEEALQKEAYAVLRKPFDIGQALALIEETTGRA